MINKGELLQWLREEADEYTSTDDRATGYYHAINVIESGEFDSKEDWGKRFEIAFENNVRYINENEQLKQHADRYRDVIETAISELEFLERSLDLPERGYDRNNFNRVMRTLRDSVKPTIQSSGGK